MIVCTIEAGVTFVFVKGANKNQLCLDGKQLATRKKWFVIVADFVPRALHKY